MSRANDEKTREKTRTSDDIDKRIAPLDGGLLEVPEDAGEETEEARLKREAAAEEHQERERAGLPRGKL